ncbi:MAG: hypothetical protein CMC53_03140 [Flavobacteriaceae bacterium]|nr:hypothetical protein [Flavobacteriaceae bacterium]
MSFFKRFSFYFFGFLIGLFFLFFLMDKKDTSFNYSPNKRVLGDILKKNWIIDSIDITFIERDKLLTEFRVDFSKSNTTLDSCKIYVIYPKSKTETFFEAENCSKTVVFKRIKL